MFSTKERGPYRGDLGKGSPQSPGQRGLQPVRCAALRPELVFPSGVTLKQLEKDYSK